MTVPDAWLSHKPARLSLREAAAVTLPYSAVWSALVKTGALAAGGDRQALEANGGVHVAQVAILGRRGRRPPEFNRAERSAGIWLRSSGAVDGDRYQGGTGTARSTYRPPGQA